MISEDIQVTIRHLDGIEASARFSTCCTVQDVVRTLVAKPPAQNRILHKDKLLQFKEVMGSLAEAGQLVLQVVRNVEAAGGDWAPMPAFAAIKDDGSVVTWGSVWQGGR
jgi:Na+-transporting NADH:ubiquinone oxidoreductase subunit NqrC